MPEIVEAPIAPRMSEGVLALPRKLLRRTPAPPADNTWRQALDLPAMQERYPLLRNAL